MDWPPEDPELARYRGPHLAVDVALFTVVPERNRLAFLVTQRAAGVHQPGEWALIGRMVRERETLAEAVRAALEDKCGLHGIHPRQLFVADDPSRDSRGWVMSAAHIATEPWEGLPARLADRPDLALVELAPALQIDYELPDGQRALPYEQDTIVRTAVNSLRDVYADRPDPGHLLPEEFTVYQLRKVHEAVLGRQLDKDVFRRQMAPALRETGRMSEASVGRPAQLFRRS